MVKQWKDPAGGVALETDLEVQCPKQGEMFHLVGEQKRMSH